MIMPWREQGVTWVGMKKLFLLMMFQTDNSCFELNDMHCNIPCLKMAPQRKEL